MTKQKQPKAEKITGLQRLALFFYDKRLLTALLSALLIGYGVISYSHLLKREGFPPIKTSFAILQGVYSGHDAADIDRSIAGPIAKAAMQVPHVKDIQFQSQDSFFGAQITYDSDVDSEHATKQVREKLRREVQLPPGVNVEISPYKMGFTDRGDDAVLSLTHRLASDTNDESLLTAAPDAGAFIKSQATETVKDAVVLKQVTSVPDPSTGGSAEARTGFERYGTREGGKTVFYRAVAIGVAKKPAADTLAFDKELRRVADEYNRVHPDQRLHVTATYAPGIKQQISELQKSLLEGLAAVLVVGSIVIALRASLITVISMVSVIALTLGLLHVIGYSLNTITLFSLVLALSLVVDDTIIMTEAIDALRRREKNRRQIIGQAVRKIGGAMVAATVTAALCFSPLLFVGGIIGEFVRAVPVTIIAALLISLLVALVLIPLLSRFLMLGKGQVGPKAKREASARVEHAIAAFISAPMLAARSRMKLAMVSGIAILLSMVVVGAGVFLSSKVRFNIFPPTKDTNSLAVTLHFPPTTTLEQAADTTDKANVIIAHELGDTFVSAANYGNASARSAWVQIDLTDYSKRTVTAPQLEQKLKLALQTLPNARATTRTLDVGPPRANFTARIQAEADHREHALRLAQDIAAYLRQARIERLDKSRVNFESVNTTDPGEYLRAGSMEYVQVEAAFKDSDTSALVGLTQSAVEKRFPPNTVASYGLPRDALSFDFGMEDENQDSFKTMLKALPFLLLAIFVVLALQFRSLLQPLLIFMAVPFSFFGVTLGLYLSDNAFSFFAMLGFFALIGLSIKNTILLTDYANQARRAGRSAPEAAHDALAERFRPLVATSFTAVVSLIPLALASPFWQGLAVVLIGGLLCSTFLVITVFPYYYLVGEALRSIGRRCVRCFKRKRGGK